MTLKQNLIAFAAIALLLSGCGGGGGKNEPLNTLHPLLAAAQGNWESYSYCQNVSGSSQVRSMMIDYRFEGYNFIEYATYYSDNSCVYPEVVHTTTHDITVVGNGPGGFGNQVDIMVTRSHLRPVTNAMAADYNYLGSCGTNWQVNVEYDISNYAYCPIYETTGGIEYTYEIGEVYRQIMDVDGDEIYFGTPIGSGHPTQYQITPQMVR